MRLIFVVRSAGGQSGARATSILGTVWDDVSKPAPSLEALNADDALELNGITPLPKSFVVTVDSTRGFPQKICSFSINGASCLLDDSGRESQIIVIRLDKPLKK